MFSSADPVCMGLATGLTLSDVSVAGLLGISESSSYSLGSGSGVCCYKRQKDQSCSQHSQITLNITEPKSELHYPLFMMKDYTSVLILKCYFSLRHIINLL